MRFTFKLVTAFDNILLISLLVCLLYNEVRYSLEVVVYKLLINYTYIALVLRKERIVFEGRGVGCPQVSP